MPSVTNVEIIFSLGPLDAFSHWFSTTTLPVLQRVIAISSMSTVSKVESPDPWERTVSARLVASEQQLIGECNKRHCRWTIFRPTLIYGAGLDKSLTSIARFAQSYRCLAIPLGASGLRQPVHADDLAWACQRVIDEPSTWNRTYQLGGGERLRFDTMLQRIRASIPNVVIPLRVPSSALRLASYMFSQSISQAALARLSSDLIADNQDAKNDFGFTPRPFMPDVECWTLQQ